MFMALVGLMVSYSVSLREVAMPVGFVGQRFHYADGDLGVLQIITPQVLRRF